MDNMKDMDKTDNMRNVENVQNTNCEDVCIAEIKECCKHDEQKDCCNSAEDKDCCKHTIRNDEERKKLINRLNRIEGQIRGIRAMVERDAYCPDILMQSAAVNAAVNSFNKDLIASHIKHCVVRGVREGNDEVIAELVDTLQKLMK